MTFFAVPGRHQLRDAAGLVAGGDDVGELLVAGQVGPRVAHEPVDVLGEAVVLAADGAPHEALAIRAPPVWAAWARSAIGWPFVSKPPSQRKTVVPPISAPGAMPSRQR